MTNERINWALKLAGAGFKIFPLRPLSKQPLLESSWLGLATTDADLIKSWFKQNPTMNYGVNPGANFAVVDLDVKSDANGTRIIQGLADQESDSSSYLDTLTVGTPSGGMHLYYRVPGEVSNAHQFPPGVDIRGSHGYVVGPGCALQNGEYIVVGFGESIADAPTWIHSRMARAHKKSDVSRAEPIGGWDKADSVERAKAFLAKRPPAIEGQGGDKHTLATALLVRDYGVSEDQCYELMLEWNERCEPPWSEDELRTKVVNAYKYAHGEPGSKAGGLLDSVISPDDSEDVQDAKRSRLDEIKFRGDEILSRKVEREMVIPGWLPAHGFTGLIGRRGSGKSTIMIDVALRLACDMDWFGTDVSQDWTAIYLCGEDVEGIADYYRAWRKEHGKCPGLDRFILMAGIVDLYNGEEVKEWAENLYKDLNGRRAVIFVDTWQRATSRVGQNDDKEMQTCVHNIEALAKALKGPAVISFHPPKDQKQSATILGHSLIENSSTALWALTKETHGLSLKVNRIKGKGEGNNHVLALKEVELGGTDQFGNKVTGVVATRIGGSEKDPELARLQKIAWAHAIRELDSYKRTLPNYKGLTMKQIAEFFSSEVEQLAVSGGLGKEVAAKSLNYLTDGGIKHFSLKSVARSLTTLFVKDPRGYQFDDGFKLVAERKSTNMVRFTVRLGLDSESEDSD